MDIELKKIKIRDLVKGYVDNDEQGVKAFDGNLNVRPAYQREFVYKDKQRDAVIDTLMKGFPLNTMYWVVGEDGKLEVLDGQQRAISVCQYFNRDFSVKDPNGNPVYFSEGDPRFDKALDYELLVYFCKGTDEEKLDWFRTINIAGEKLTDQELLNINYTGPWLSAAKAYFSKTNGPAYRLAKDYVKGTPNRQEFLETALSWISNGDIPKYMADHRNDKDADELIKSFEDTIDWAKKLFGKHYRKELKGLDWGLMFSKYGKKYSSGDAEALEAEVAKLMKDDEVTDKKGIYEYVLSGKDERLARKLSKRAFSESDKRTKYEEQKGICPKCGKHFEIEEMEGDHIIPWWRAGKTDISNLQMLCKACNSGKAGKAD